MGTTAFRLACQEPKNNVHRLYSWVCIHIHIINGKKLKSNEWFPFSLNLCVMKSQRQGTHFFQREPKLLKGYILGIFGD